MWTLAYKHKIWGKNWLYLRPYLKAFPVFNVLETKITQTRGPWDSPRQNPGENTACSAIIHILTIIIIAVSFTSIITIIINAIIIITTFFITSIITIVNITIIIIITISISAIIIIITMITTMTIVFFFFSVYIYLMAINSGPNL